jgi:hypothetical protein
MMTGNQESLYARDMIVKQREGALTQSTKKEKEKLQMEYIIKTESLPPYHAQC